MGPFRRWSVYGLVRAKHAPYNAAMPLDEQVLVVERSVLEQAGMFQGLTFEVERYMPRLFAAGVPRFTIRAEAETNPALKQLIPYVILAGGDKYLTYVRGKRAGETRLVGHRSIGIGGHINPADDMPLFCDNMFETYLAAVEREVAEEVTIDGAHADRIVALLNDDSTEVGRVHLGIVHFWSLASPQVTRREQMITQLSLMSLGELEELRGTMETWSQLCLDHLEQIAQRAGQAGLTTTGAVSSMRDRPG